MVLAVRTLLAQRHFAISICVATLLLKLLIPTGYMIDNDHGHMTITLCSGVVPSTGAMAMTRKQGNMPDHGKSNDHGRADMPCAFSGLSAAMTGAIDPIQLKALIGFVMATGLIVVMLPTPDEPARLRPPLRGPPPTP
jgi:hypothetical protein